MPSNTEEFIFSQMAKYPKLTHKDLLKAIYQSVFGCSHLIDDAEKASHYLNVEMNSAACDDCCIENFDGEYCRVPLPYIKMHRISPDNFSKLLAISASECSGTIEELEEKLAVLSEMCRCGELPFDSDVVKADIDLWRADGFLPCHHSEMFHTLYKPAYRVIHKRYAKLLPILGYIDTHQNERLTMAIDGNSCAGKSYLAKLLNTIYDCNVFHMDDYFLRPEQRTAERFACPGGNIDRERFEEEILIPLSKSSELSFRPFDCSSFSLSEPIRVDYKKLNIIEGSYSMHPELQKYYDLSVFLSVSAETQSRRVKTRDPEMAEMFFARWIPMENTYFEVFDIKSSCDIAVETD